MNRDNYPKRLFHFKKFSLSDADCGMKIGTDGVLLGSIAANYISPSRILDIGTGSGLIALMIAQKNPGHITAIEIESQAARQARQNVGNSPWAERINVLEISFQDYLLSAPGCFDLIVCNPPFFSGSLKPACEKRHAARHCSLLSFEELLEGAGSILENDGKLLMIIPANQDEVLENIARDSALKANSKIWIIPSTGKPAKRLIIEFSAQDKPLNETSLVIEDKGRHGYSNQYIELTREYYINL